MHIVFLENLQRLQVVFDVTDLTKSHEIPVTHEMCYLRNDDDAGGIGLHRTGWLGQFIETTDRPAFLCSDCDTFCDLHTFQSNMTVFFRNCNCD